MRKYKLAEMTWKEVKDAVNLDPVVLIPLGSQEEHGPQSPTGDWMITEVIAAKVAETTDSIMAPINPFGYSEYFRSYPGTISLRAETMANLVEDVLVSLLAAGFHRLVLFNGHAGNAGILELVARKVRAEHKVRVVTLTPNAFRSESLMRELYGERMDAVGHGGEPLSSIWMHLRPEIMDIDAAAKGQYREFHGLKPKGLSNAGFQDGQVALYFDMDEISVDGSVGDSTMASADKGKAVLEAMIRGCVQFVEWYKTFNPVVEG